MYRQRLIAVARAEPDGGRPLTNGLGSPEKDLHAGERPTGVCERLYFCRGFNASRSLSPSDPKPASGAASARAVYSRTSAASLAS